MSKRTAETSVAVSDVELGARSMVTPVLLTYNEEVNIARTLAGLRWARRVIVVDSYSNDQTECIARSFSNVSWYQRGFDSHGAQWTFALRETGIDTPYALALDADMEVTVAFVDELRSRFLTGAFGGGVLCFRMVLEGKVLRSGLYPAQLRVFRPEQVSIRQRGHTQVFETNGPHYRFSSPVMHEDRKSLDWWVKAQLAYASLEAERIKREGIHTWKDRIRMCWWMPAIAGLLGYVLAGGPAGGRGAARYALERAMFESLLAIRLIEQGRQDSVK